MMRYIYDRLKRSSFRRKYLTDGAFINFLKRVKHFLGRCKRKLRSMFPKERHVDNILSVIHQYLLTELKYPEDMEEVDIIVPIYNGYDYLVKLFEDLLKTKMKCRIILVDDKSTDERVLQLEREFARLHSNVIVLENERNYGFVKSVNRGLSISKNHVALVNTDTELPDGWLERLMYPILNDDKVASTTPYTNSATIFSFPNICYNNQIYRGKNVNTLDSYFRMVRPRYVEVPTGVGFCMGLSKYAIEKVGVLDYETFDRGFGEENDWCQRAVKKGFKNVQVENLFVYHKHGGSFLSEEKEQLLKKHLEQLNKRFPAYDYQVNTFIRKDPNKKLRQLLEMLIDTHETKSILYFDHSLGGGATSYLNTKKEEFLGESYCVSVVRYCIENNNYRFLFDNGSISLEYEFQALTDIIEVGKWLHFDEIYINELVTYPKLWDVMDCIAQLKEQQNSKLIMLFHDFFALCPTINLLNTKRQYCGMPDENICEQCYLQKGFDSQYGCKSRKEWLSHWQMFLEKCTEVRTFSKDTYERVRKEFGEKPVLTLVPHKVEYVFQIYKKCKTTDTLNIGLLGVMAIHKGSNYIKELLEEIDRRGLNVKIKLIGKQEEGNLKNYHSFEETGKYQPSQLPKLIYENDIDIFLISSIWPETFSYTAEEVIKMGMPIAAFDLGAPAERIRKYDKGLILEQRDPGLVLEQIRHFTMDQLNVGSTRVNYKKVVYLAEYFSFSSRYRIEHMQEELLYQGVAGEIWKTESLPKKIQWEEIGTMIIYRCRLLEPLKSLILEAKRRGIRLIYDIDDFIFEYDSIKELPFMADKEYRGFEKYSALIYQCMQQCDGITVSTEHLAQAVRKAFPQKSVYVNRNVASAEMLILSALAQHRKRKHIDRVVLGYFSGSNTHGRDFELISDVLLELMQEHENVYLKIVGCLELPDGFRKVKERILSEGFMDWQKLPDAIASVDINLMPLEDTFFHACKSENKWLEAALVKVPTVGSYNEEIAHATCSGKNILLCKTKEEWKTNLEFLIQSEAKRREIAQLAYDYVVENKTTLHKDGALLGFVMEKNARETENDE